MEGSHSQNILLVGNAFILGLRVLKSRDDSSGDSRLQTITDSPGSVRGESESNTILILFLYWLPRIQHGISNPAILMTPIRHGLGCVDLYFNQD